MAKPEPHEGKPADPEHGNIYWNYFRLIAPYVYSLIILLVIFYLFPTRRIFQFSAFVFFVSLAVLLLTSGSKLVEFYFTFIYLPIYLVYVLSYLFAWRKKK
ncbi:MAG: hypothetical protein I3270_00280 [Candidatus Moeniiplasma glomeromycotorum]|nr:hypothetical protein [Candidatus Moeniiplasma glomeromycotorum]MCE8166078.1 hypothetical protein [Candidatus Moeniiplasma glomeromycotorum]